MNRIRTATGIIGFSIAAHIFLFLISLLLTKDNLIRTFVIPGVATFLSGIVADTILLSLSAAIPVAAAPVALLIWGYFHPQAGDAGMGFMIGLSIFSIIAVCAATCAAVGCYVGRIAIPRIQPDAKPIDFSKTAAAVIIACSTGIVWWSLLALCYRL